MLQLERHRRELEARRTQDEFQARIEASRAEIAAVSAQTWEHKQRVAIGVDEPAGVSELRARLGAMGRELSSIEA